MNTRAAAFLTLAVLTVLAGCASSGVPGLRPLTYAVPGQTQLLVSAYPCPHSDPNAEVSALVVSTLATIGSDLLTRFGNALTEAAKGGKLVPSTATRNFEPRQGAVPKCLVVVRGEFAEGATPLESLLGEDADALPKEGLKALHLPTMTHLDHYIELSVRASSAQGYLSFSPVFVALKRSIDGETKGNRGVSLEVQLKKAGAAAATGSVS